MVGSKCRDFKNREVSNVNAPTDDFIFYLVCSSARTNLCILINTHPPDRYVRPKKKNCYMYVALTRPKLENWVGRSGFFFFFFFFFYVPWESWVFQYFFFQFLNGENSGGMQSKRIYKSCKCFFKPLNTNFSKFFAQIWHKKKKKKKKKPTLFFSHFTVGRERAT